MKKVIRRIGDPFWLSFVGALIALGILAWLKFSPQLKERQNRSWLADKIDTIDKIEIVNGEEKDTLVKKDGQWLVTSENDLPADKEKIEQLLASLEKLKKTELVSKNESYHHKFGVNQESAIGLKVYQGETTLLHLLVGNAGPDFESNYIRFPEQKEVYLSSVALRSTLIQPRWKNLKVTDFYSDEVEKLIIKRGQNQKEFDSEKAKDLVNQLTGIQANDAQAGSIAEPTTTITIKLKENRGEISLKLGEKDKSGQRYCQKNEESVIYLLPSWLDEKIDEGVQQLLSTT